MITTHHSVISKPLEAGLSLVLSSMLEPRVCVELELISTFARVS